MDGTDTTPKGVPLSLPLAGNAHAEVWMMGGRPRAMTPGGKRKPIPGAQLWTLDKAGAPLPTYADAAYSIPFGPCVTANAEGGFPEIHARGGVEATLVLANPVGQELLRWNVSIAPNAA
jgi:hypothetical protein